MDIEIKLRDCQLHYRFNAENPSKMNVSSQLNMNIGTFKISNSYMVS